MKRRTGYSRKIIIMAMFVSIGIVLQYAESRIMITPLPGGKLGLANIVTITNIFMFGAKNAVMISVIRAFLGTLLSSGVSALPYSVLGALFSTLSMCVVKKYLFPKASVIGMSVIGAAVHNVAQILVSSAVFASVYIFSYLPVLLVVAALSGAITGYFAQILVKRIEKG